ncbi:MAG: 3-phosphoshikimate 1-carboxyvinyltransferase, partial [Deltaproteobacteria bacterium]|nr:3-phosphoshikimate 1-carboxyvinyltransferase [Deltaproteobacteria bacterium]
MKKNMRIKPLKKLDATVRIPGSKSLTQRALVIASLAEGRSCLHNALISEDTNHLIKALRLFGISILITEEGIVVEKTKDRLHNPGETIYLGNNGTSLRFLTSLAALATGEVSIDGGDRLRERPLGPIMEALRSLGVRCRSLRNEGYPPVAIKGGGINGGRVIFNNSQSSQYISSLLIVAPCAKGTVEIGLRGETLSMPYIHMTIDVMNRFGVEVLRHGETGYTVRAPQAYRGQTYTVESDLSNASYFFLAAALCKGRVIVPDINPDTIQGDIKVLEIIEKMGSSVTISKNCVDVIGKELVRGDMEFDMASMPDM